MSHVHGDKNPPGQEGHFHVRPGDSCCDPEGLPPQGVMRALASTLLASYRNPLGSAQPRAGVSIKAAGSGCLGQSQGTGSARPQGPPWKRPCLNLSRRAGSRSGVRGWSTEPSKAWGRVCSEGGQEPLESNRRIRVPKRSLRLLPGWGQGTRTQWGVQLTNAATVP